MFTDTDRAMMTVALEEALEALREGEIPVGAVVARGSEIIARAHNTREKSLDPTGHAEINALRLAAQKTGDWRLTGCTLYVTLEPCCMCAGAIGQARPDRVIFGAYDTQAGCCVSLYRLTEDPAFAWYVPSDGGLMADRCSALLRDALKPRRVPIVPADTEKINLGVSKDADKRVN